MDESVESQLEASVRLLTQLQKLGNEDRQTLIDFLESQSGSPLATAARASSNAGAEVVRRNRPKFDRFFDRLSRAFGKARLVYFGYKIPSYVHWLQSQPVWLQLIEHAAKLL